MTPLAPERVRIHFRYRRGQRVRYAGRPTPRYIVTQQRYTRRDVLSPLYEYLLAPTRPYRRERAIRRHKPFIARESVALPLHTRR